MSESGCLWLSDEGSVVISDDLSSGLDVVAYWASLLHLEPLSSPNSYLTPTIGPTSTPTLTPVSPTTTPTHTPTAMPPPLQLGLRRRAWFPPLELVPLGQPLIVNQNSLPER